MTIENFLKELNALSTEEHREQALKATRERKQSLYKQGNKENLFEISLKDILDTTTGKGLTCRIKFRATMPTLETTHRAKPSTLTKLRKAKFIDALKQNDMRGFSVSDLKIEFTASDETTSTLSAPFNPNFKVATGPCFADLLSSYGEVSSFGGMATDTIDFVISGEYAQGLVLNFPPEAITQIKNKPLHRAIIEATTRKQLLEEKTPEKR
ncbi:MAG: hypothetical protein J6J24_02985 [Clostridia bacterium]|nr:hypothetical protein [Clostridia bacterium]